MRIRDIEARSKTINKKTKQKVSENQQSAYERAHIAAIPFAIAFALIAGAANQTNNWVKSLNDGTTGISIPVDKYDTIYASLEAQVGTQPYYEVEGLYVRVNGKKSRVFFTKDGLVRGFEAPITGLSVEPINGAYQLIADKKYSAGISKMVRKPVTETASEIVQTSMATLATFATISAIMAQYIHYDHQIVSMRVPKTEYSQVYKTLKRQYGNKANPVFVAEGLYIENSEHTLFKVFLTVEGPRAGIEAPIDDLAFPEDGQGNYIFYVERNKAGSLKKAVTEAKAVIKKRSTLDESLFDTALEHKYKVMGAYIVLKMIGHFNDVYINPSQRIQIPVESYQTFYNRLKSKGGPEMGDVFVLEGLYANKNEEFKIFMTPDGPKVGIEAPINDLPVPMTADGSAYQFTVARSIIRDNPEMFTP